MTLEERDPSALTVIVPTFNAADRWQHWIKALKNQTYPIQQVFVIDSGSTDNTVQLARDGGFITHIIANEEFDHGGTRQLALTLAQPADIVLFLTQDAILEGPDSIAKLMTCFADEQVAAAYGRQLPHKNAGPVSTHARYFNYPRQSMIKGKNEISLYGFKTIFISNSFAAYRRSTLDKVGGFAPRCIFGEDTCVAAKLILDGWQIAYCAQAQVYHSHDYDFMQEFRRYFDIGVFHATEHWLIDNFRSPGSEGWRFLRSELAFLWKNRPVLIPSALLRTALKFLGYKMGGHEKNIPRSLKSLLSMNKKYWLNPQH